MDDQALITVARKLAQARYVPGKHQMFSALRTRSGQVFTGVHVEAGNGRMSLCAEAVAIGAAATGGDTDIECIVAVTESGDVAPPCGMCRELIGDYAPAARVLLMDGGAVLSRRIAELLPAKYRSADYPNTRQGGQAAEPGGAPDGGLASERSFSGAFPQLVEKLCPDPDYIKPLGGQ